MEFKKYQHIVKLGCDEVDGILNGTVYLFYKIDGTNSQIFLKDDGATLGFGSRNREVSPADDNAAFATTFEDEDHKNEYNERLRILQAHPNYIIYGEWLVPHTLKTYAVDAWKKFYVFDVLDTATGKYLTYEEYETLFSGCSDVSIIPLLAKLENPTADDIKAKLQDTGHFLCVSGLGEGIVIKNYEFINKYGRRNWAKRLTEDFLSTKHGTRQHNKQVKQGQCEHPTEEKIIEKYLTVEHICKEYYKLCEKYKEAVLNPSHTFELLNVVFHEFISDNWEIILNKLHLPTINFKVLKQLSDDKVKQTILVKADN